MRKVCVQFQPDLVPEAEAKVRDAFRRALPDADVEVGEDDGRYENFTFDVESPQQAMSKVRTVLDAPGIGPAARASCIVTCEGEHGWDDYLLLHHYETAENDDPDEGE